MGGLAEKRIFGRSLLAFTLAATLAFPAASLSFVAQAFADDPSNGDAAEAPAAPVVDPVKSGEIHGIDFMTPTAEDGMWDLFRVENGAGKTIYRKTAKPSRRVSPTLFPRRRIPIPRQRMPTLPRPTTLAMPTPLASPKLSR